MIKNPSVLSGVLVACLSMAIPTPAETPAGGEAAQRTQSSKREPKWEFSVEGMPDLSGRTIVALGAGATAMYSIAASNTSISINLHGGTRTPRLVINYKDQKVMCMNYGGVETTIDGSRANLAGEVECGARGAERTKAAISGWFTLKE